MKKRRWKHYIVPVCLVLAVLLFMGGYASGDKKGVIKMSGNIETAIFAGGCFWCMETPYEKLPGVSKAISGYTGGREVHPGYEEVASGSTGHVEAVQIYYDPAIISYEDLLEVFWRNIDPTDAGGQFVDRGKQYTTAVFYQNEGQKQVAQKSKENLARSGRFKKPIVTPIIKAGEFYPAEDYHQDFFKKSPVRYNLYRVGSGRDQFIEKVWGDERHYRPAEKGKDKHGALTEEELKSRLSAIQYRVTQENGTEPPFMNEFWNNKEPGIYVDVVSGEPLFSSQDKFDSGTGWPSFTKPLVTENIVALRDTSLHMVRTEVRSGQADSHLGHLFEDGPAPTGLRYCINSASLRFIPVEKLKEEGYEQFAKTFDVAGKKQAR